MKIILAMAAAILLSFAVASFAFAPKQIALTPPSEPVPATVWHAHSSHGFSQWNRATNSVAGRAGPAVAIVGRQSDLARSEPGKGQWHFENLDRSVALAEAHHASVLLTLGLTPRWASLAPKENVGYVSGYAAEPKDIEDWRVFVRTVATRYQGRIHAYEIWNEPKCEEVLDRQHRPAGHLNSRSVDHHS